MTLFSDRYGYTKLSEAIVRETMTREIENALCSCYDLLEKELSERDYRDETYSAMELFLWMNFLNERRNDFFHSYGSHAVVVTPVLKDKKYEWYSKLNMVEMSVKWLYAKSETNHLLRRITDAFTERVNYEFERLHYAYRFVGEEIIEITAKEEINSIEEAVKKSEDNVKMHLQSAIALLSKKPTGEFRNSIKESITAVEAACRDLTGKRTLGEALNELSNVGVVIPSVLKSSLEKLYGYTNNRETGIRHALMDEEGTYVPSSAEAVFMLVSCSAFINYLNAKRAS